MREDIHDTSMGEGTLGLHGKDRGDTEGQSRIQLGVDGCGWVRMGVLV